MDDIHNVGFAPSFEEKLQSDGVDSADSVGWSWHELELSFSEFARRVSDHPVSETLPPIQCVGMVGDLADLSS